MGIEGMLNLLAKTKGLLLSVSLRTITNLPFQFVLLPLFTN